MATRSSSSSGGDYTTMRIWTRTLRTLRIIAAYSGHSMVEVLDRLVNEEYRRQVDAGKIPSGRPPSEQSNDNDTLRDT